jgi:type II secretory pathway component PulF
MGSFAKNETSLAALTQMMAGGEELERLSRELEKMATDPETTQVARAIADEVVHPEHPG